MIKVAINGFGRIGRPTFKKLIENPNIQVVAINDLTDNKTLMHLLKYDSVYGRYDKEINCKMLTEKDPTQLPWKKLEVDVVLECTGFFTDPEGASKHLKAGAKKVIVSAPCKGAEMPTYIFGGNEEKYDSRKEDVISMGSCTTNCAVPVAKVVNDNFQIEGALMTAIHSYTSNQKLVDGPHKDLRRGRAAAINLIPTTTGAAISVIRALPELEGKLDGIAIRIPMIDVCLLEFVAQIKKLTTSDVVNKVFKQASQKELKGILAVEDLPLVSTDFIGNPYSAIVDSQFTMVEGKNLVKVLAWYDNEWGYACRLAEMAEFVGKKL